MFELLLWLVSKRERLGYCLETYQTGHFVAEDHYTITSTCHQYRRLLSAVTLFFLDHTQRHTTVGRTPLGEWVARRRYLYLTTHNNHNRGIHAPLWDSNPQSQQASGCRPTLRPRGHWDRRLSLLTDDQPIRKQHLRTAQFFFPIGWLFSLSVPPWGRPLQWHCIS